MKVTALAVARETFSALKDALEKVGYEIVWIDDGEAQENTKHEVKINEFNRIIIAIAKYSTDSPYSNWGAEPPNSTPSVAPWRQQMLENGHKYDDTIDTQRLPLLRSHDFTSHPISAPKHGRVTPMQMTVDIDLSSHRGLAFRLTKRQIDVLSAMVKGKTNKQIARELGCSHATVRNHLTSIFKELGVSTRTEASFIAREAGLI